MILVLNIIAGLSLLAYPFVLVAGVMSLGGANGSLTGLALGLGSILYPVLVIGLIVVSRNTDSVPLALLGTMPTLVLFWVLVAGDTLSSQKVARKEFDQKDRQFTCGPDEFIYVQPSDQARHRDQITWHQRKYSFWYQRKELGDVFKSKWIFTQAAPGHPFQKDQVRTMERCKDAAGKSLVQTYELVTELKKIQAIHKQFQKK